jgi:hypothetical protein
MAPAWHPDEAHDLWIILCKDIANVSDQIERPRTPVLTLLTRGTEKPLEILEDEHTTKQCRSRPQEHGRSVLIFTTPPRPMSIRQAISRRLRIRF